MDNSKVPKFGAWEGGEDVAYSTYFENARKNKTRGQMNPNEPQMNRDVLPRRDPPAHASHPALKTEPKEPPTYEQRGFTKEGGDFRKGAHSLSRQDNSSQGSSKDQQVNQRSGGRGSVETPHKLASQTAVSDSNFEKSPFHPRAAGRGSNGPPSFDGKSSSDSVSGAQGRHRPKQGSQAPDKGPSVPEFGAWNKNPAQAEGYTHVFDVVRQERRGGTTPENINQSSHQNTPAHHTKNEPKQGRCCPWF
ncbi:hypothetical protein Ancab_040678 [Ancistrocladus abbreviatus]